MIFYGVSRNVDVTLVSKVKVKLAKRRLKIRQNLSYDW